MKRFALILILAALSAAACDNRPRAAAGKPKYLWFDATANFERFAVRDSVDLYLDKACRAGFNRIVVDVRPVEGDVLYASDFMTQATTIGSVTVPARGWDYLQFFLDEAHKRGLKVTVSTTIFPMGMPSTRQGPVYRDSKWNARPACKTSPRRAAAAN